MPDCVRLRPISFRYLNPTNQQQTWCPGFTSHHQLQTGVCRWYQFQSSSQPTRLSSVDSLSCRPAGWLAFAKQTLVTHTMVNDQFNPSPPPPSCPARRYYQSMNAKKGEAHVQMHTRYCCQRPTLRRATPLFLAEETQTLYIVYYLFSPPERSITELEETKI